jgi:uncharacterized protein (DUF2141 family)
MAPGSIFRRDYINISGKEMTYPIDGLDYGEYLVAVVHDENKNFIPDLDKDGKLLEGFGFANQDKLKFTKPDGIKYDLAKFNFYKNEMTVDIKVSYPPFP